MIFTQLNITWIALFILLIVSIIFFGYSYFSKQKKLKNTYSLLLKEDKSILEMFLIALSIILLSFGLLGPKNFQNTETSSVEGIDIIIVLDVSKSMNARDVQQGNNFYSRIDASKLLVKNYVINNPANRYGLVVFAGDSVNVSPLTSDQDIFLTFLQSVDYRNVSAQGSNLALAYELGTQRLSVDSESAAIIMISDGGDTDDTLDSDAIQKSYLSQKNYTVVLGVGTTDGAKIPIGNDFFGETQWQTFRGEDIITKLNRKNLEKVADLTKGDYIAIQSIDDIEEIEDRLSNIETKAIESGSNSDYTDMKRMLSFLAFISFISYLFLPFWKSSHIRHK